MNDAHNPSVEEIFAEALRLPTPEGRAAYLQQVCGHDEPLRRRVEALLHDHDNAGQFLNNPPAAVFVRTLAITTGMVPPTEKPGDRIGRYKLLEKLGEGGCGAVYVAEQEQPVRRRVALKVIKLGMDTRQVIARFEAERQALALMDHPNIAKVLDGGATETGRPFFVMELVKGVRITDYCDKNNLSTTERLGLFIQVCHAIQHAHQKGIIHRDIKPSNILVTLQNGVPEPKVIDFGIAKATTDQRLTDKTLYTAIEQFIGTPAYMSPEQAELSGLDIDTRSDIYALGVLLYELLTGKTPFDAQRLVAAGLDEIRRIIREEDPPRPSTRISTLEAGEQTAVAKRRHSEAPRLIHLVRGDLDWIVMKCLEKDRTRRYDTANGLALDLERHLTDEPVTARPPGALYRFQKMVRRNKLTFAAATAVALALSLGIIGSAWQAVRARRAERAKTLLYQTAQTEAQRAEQAVAEIKGALSASDFKEAMRLIDEDSRPRALAYLARSLAANPTNDAALTRLTTLLTYHWWPLPPSRVIRQGEGVTSAQFSPDGKWIVTVSTNTARVWDASSGQPLTEPMKHKTWVTSAQFSPGGKWIVTVSANSARVWDAPSGQPLTEPMMHKTWVTSAQFSPDGKRIVTVATNTARVWDAPSGQPLTEPMKHNGPVSSAQFSSDGKRIVTVSYDRLADVPDTRRHDRTARVWDAQSGQLLTELLKHDDEVNSVQFSPDGKRIVTTSGDSTARMWDAQSGQPLSAPMKHNEFVSSAQFSSDEKRIVTVSHDNRTRVWDAESGQPFTQPMKHTGDVTSAQFSLDGKRIVTASENTVRVWDAESGKALSEPMKHKDRVQSAQFSPDGHWILTVSKDGVVRLWDARGGHALSELLKHNQRVNSAQFSPDGQRIVTASDDDTARVWDEHSAQPLAEPMKHKGGVNSARFSPDGQRVVTASDDNTAQVWDAQSGKALSEPMKHKDRVQSAQYSPDGKRIVTVATNTAQVWDAHNGLPLTEPMKHNKTVNSARFSPDGQRIVTASDDDTARVWDAHSAQPLTEPLKHNESVNSARFSPDGQRVVTASHDNTARVWDAQSGKALSKPLKHNGSVNSAQYSPDGKQIVTASDDKTARVWDAQTSQLLSEPMKDNGKVTSAQFSPDGRRVVTVSGGGVRVWDPQTGQALTEPMECDWYLFPTPDGKRLVTVSEGGVRVWDARTGQPLAEPMENDWFKSPALDGLVSSALSAVWGGGALCPAQFSPDGKRIVAASVDGTGRVWDIAPCGKECPDWLRALAEAVAGERLNKEGVLEVTRQDFGEALEGIRQRLDREPTNDDWVVWGRWFLEDRATRTISPFSKLTMPEYVERQAKEVIAVGVAVSNVAVLNEKGWLFATSPRANVRDGRVAVALAEKAVAVTERKDPVYLDTLAAAYAELGQFSRAVSIQQEALGLIQDEKIKEDYSSRLKLYQSDSPYRDSSTNELVGAAEDKKWRADFVRTRGMLAAQFGLWKEGVRDLEEAVALHPDEHWNWYQLAPLLLETGDVEGYRQHCQKMLARFGVTTDPPIAERAAKVCLMIPVSQQDLAVAGKLAETAVTLGKDNAWAAYFQFAKGLAEYRAGNFEKAVGWTKKALEQAGLYYRDVQAYAVLAMAQQRLNRADEARAALGKAAEIADAKLAKRGSGDLGAAWHDWIIAQTLLREAKQLIEGSSKAGDETK